MKIQTSIKLGFLAAGLLSLSQGIAQQKNPGIAVDLMDKSVRPNDNFFQFVNGTWLKNTAIPADKTRWGSFDELRQNTDKDALAILNAASKDPKYKSNTDQGKAINIYKSVMDTVARNKQGIKPIQADLAKINAIKNTADLQKLLMETEAVGGGAGFFGFGIGADEKNSNRNIVSLGPGSLGLPDRDYYVSEDKDSKETSEELPDIEGELSSLGDEENTPSGGDFGVDPKLTKLQNALKAAYDAAKEMGDDKLSTQIGNTITYFTRTHVVTDEKAPVAEVRNYIKNFIRKHK